jgi:hypothetical protein
MEWKLTDTQKGIYDKLLTTAQQIEATIGSNEFRIHKLLEMRKEIDVTLKKWWDETITEMKLDPKRDYMITNDGKIQDVSKEPESSVPVVPASEVSKPATIDDLK